EPLVLGLELLDESMCVRRIADADLDLPGLPVVAELRSPHELDVVEVDGELAAQLVEDLIQLAGLDGARVELDGAHLVELGPGVEQADGAAEPRQRGDEYSAAVEVHVAPCSGQ